MKMLNKVQILYYKSMPSSLPLKQPRPHSALKRCNATDRRWIRYAVSKGLSVVRVKRRTSSYKNSLLCNRWDPMTRRLERQCGVSLKVQHIWLFFVVALSLLSFLINEYLTGVKIFLYAFFLNLYSKYGINFAIEFEITS